MPIGGVADSRPEHWTDTQGRAFLNVWSVRQGHHRRQYRTKHKGDTPSPRVEIKIEDGLVITVRMSQINQYSI